MKKKLSFGSIFILIALAAHTPYVSGASSAGNFLTIGAGARPVAMGEAFTALGGDADSLAWNPAGLASVQGDSLRAAHAQWFEGIGIGFAGFAHRLPGNGVIGASARYLWTGSMDITTDSDPGGTGETYGAQDLAVSLAYAKAISAPLSLGVNVKFIRESIAAQSGSAAAADLGAQYVLSDNVTFGASVSNLGTSLKLIDKEFDLPTETRLGVSYLFPGKKIIFAGDLKLDENSSLSEQIGLEMTANEFIALRAGYKTENGKNTNGLSGLSAGMGIRFNNCSLDYAWVPYGDLGDTHRIGFGFQFANKK